VINTQFRDAGGTSAGYRAAVAAATARGWLTLTSLQRIFIISQFGAAVFARDRFIAAFW
jgi:hypothetical protein